MDNADLLIQIKEEYAKLREENARIKDEFEALKSSVPQIQHGVFEFTDGWTRGVWPLGRKTAPGDRFYSPRIEFKTAFSVVPKVNISILRLDTGNSPVRVKINAIEVTTEGFTLDIGTWSDSEVYGIRVDWLAISAPHLV